MEAATFEYQHSDDKINRDIKISITEKNDEILEGFTLKRQVKRQAELGVPHSKIQVELE